VAIKVQNRNTFLKKSIGLLKNKTIIPIYFKTRFGIHTFGMKQDMDVLILNSECIVVSQKLFLKPNRIFLWNPFYSSVVELHGGFIKKHNLKIGDRVKLALV